MKLADSSYDHQSTPLSQQAAHWWVVLNDEACTAADRERFTDWVRRSPERVEAFLRVNMLTSALHSGDIRWPDTSAEELIRQANAASAEVIPLWRPSRADEAAGAQRRNPSLMRSTRMLLCASVATLFAVILVVWMTGPQRYRTGLGEQLSVVLEDGSIVTLNTSSEIEVKYGAQRRFIRLVSGEALFDVAHDAARPFDVGAGNTFVRAVGTQFNVDRRADRTTVTVVEGKVRVSTRAEGPPGTASGSSATSAEPFEEFIVAAQRVVVTQSGMSAPEQIHNIAPVTSWTQRQLVFENRPLSEVAAEFNRYNRRHVLIESPELQVQQVTGVFQANDSASFLAFISGIPGVSVQTDGDGHHVVSIDSVRGEEFGAGGGPN